MIYLDDKTTPQAMFIPKAVTGQAGELSLRMVSTVDNTTPVDVTVVNVDTHDLYYNVAVALPEDAQPGEYEYTLTAGGIVVSDGIVIVGEPKNQYNEYGNQEQYEQYEG